ncbi:MAG: hypothetical protein OXE50_04025 [Chloroflexi bacterium]|nr:hypothetical protein [Chloroflexota bacterium]
MLVNVRTSLRVSLRSAAAVTLMLLMLAAFAAACSDPEPTATPTPRPTPTPTPTATPTPAPTPTPTPTPEPAPMEEPTPDAMMPKPEAGSVDDLVITDSTTVGDLMAVLSETEVLCLRDAVGAATLDAVQNLPLADAPPGALGALPFECLSQENAIGISIAMMSADAGGLSEETRGCISALATENPSVLGIGGPPEDPAELFGTAIQMQLCMTDEEAARFAADSGAAMPPPSVMRCIEEQLGSLDDLLILFTGAEPDLSKIGELMAAAQECGLDSALPGGGSLQGQ